MKATLTFLGLVFYYGAAFAQSVVFTEDFDVTIGTDAIGGVGNFSYGLDEDGAGQAYKQIDVGVWGAVKASDSFDDIDAQPNTDGATSAKLLGTILDSSVLNQGAGSYTLQFDVIGADAGAAYVYVDAGWNYDTSGANTLILDVANAGFSSGTWTPLTGTGNVMVSNLVAQSINTTQNVTGLSVDFEYDGVSGISVAFGAYDSNVAFDNVIISSPNTNDAPVVAIDATLGKYEELDEGSTRSLQVSASDSGGTIARIEVRIDGALVDASTNTNDHISANLFATLVPGVYTLEAIAWDNLGSSASDSRTFYIVPSDGELTGQHPYYAGLGKIKEYLRFIPDDYNTSTNKQWPLIVWLHGAGNRGSDALTLRGAGGPPSRIKNNDPLLDDFIVLSPQCVSGGWWGGNSEQNQIDILVDELVARFRVDPERIIITGQSMGGYGTYTSILRHPDKYAAAVPICGSGDESSAASIAHMPIWIFHGDSDNTVPYQHSVDMYNALTNAGAQNTSFHTITNGPHNVWTETYQRADLYEWMLLNTGGVVPTEPSYGGNGGAPSTDYTLVWSDEFNGSSLDTSKWAKRDENRRGHLWDPEDVYMNNGNLVLRTRENPADADDHNYSSGAIRSEGLFETTYGYFEARCRIPKTAGGWSAFWLYSESVKTVGNEGNDGTEIDIMETPFISSDTNDTRIVTDLHWDGYGEDHKHANEKISNDNFTQGSWHVFGLEWTPTEYKWYFDGELVRTSSAGGVCDVDLFIQLTSEVGWWDGAAPWGGSPIENEPLPDEFRVDWVRVWKRAADIGISREGIDIVDGDDTPNSVDGTDFGEISVSGLDVIRSFTVTNTGDQPLNFNTTPPVLLTGEHVSDFSVVAQLPASLAVGSTTNFTIRFDPSVGGDRSAMVTIASNDPDEAAYSFAIKGVGLDGEPSYGGNGGAPSGEYQLFWFDEFNDISLNTNKWTAYDRQKRASYWTPDDAYLEDGHLVLRTRRNAPDSGDPEYTAGAVHSEGKFETAYGYFEARCRLPATAGGWSAFWLHTESVKTIGDDGNDGTEIDIMESPFISNAPEDTRIVTALHYDGYGADHRSEAEQIVNSTMTQGSWHVFAVEWTPNEYRWYFDGELVRRSSFGGVSDVDQFIKFTSVIGNDGDAYPWGGIPAENEPLPDEFRVDWVRVWKVADVDSVPPLPNPASWATPPTAVGDSAVTMTASTGRDPGGTVEYYFEETSGNSGGTDSGWQTSTTYTDTGLQPETQYTYVVRMRDPAGNVGTNSAATSVTTDPSSSGYTVQIDFEDISTTPIAGGFWNEMGAPTDLVLKDSAVNTTAVSISSWVNFSGGNGDEASSYDFSTTEWGESAQDYFDCSGTGSFTLTGFLETDMIEVSLIAIENNRRDIDFQINGSFGEGNAPYNGDNYHSRNAWANGHVATWSGLTGTNRYTVTATPTDGDIPVISALRIIVTPAADPHLDSDGDGLPDSLEVSIGTDPSLSDSDGDGIDDMVAYALDADSFPSMAEALPTLGSRPAGIVFSIPKTQTSNILYSVETASSMTGLWYRIAFKEAGGTWQKDAVDDDTPLYGGIHQVTVNPNADGVDVIDAKSRLRGFYRPQFIHTP